MKLQTSFAALLLLSSPVLAQSEATFEGLGDLDGGTIYSEAIDVSADGSVIVGIASFGFSGFRWENGAMTELGYYDDSDATWVNGVSGDGSSVVGTAEFNYPDGSVSLVAVRWQGESWAPLGDFSGGGDWSEAFGTSADGSVVVGYGTTETGNLAFRREGGEMVGLGYLPGGTSSGAFDVSVDGSVIVGYSSSGNSSNEAFRWEDGVMEGLGDLPGGSFYSRALAVSADDSVVVGFSSSENSPIEAFRWENGTMQGFGIAPGGNIRSKALGVSADGSIVVGVEISSSGISVGALIWTEGTGVQNLKEVLETEYGLDLTGWTLKEATGISDDGTVIVGTGTNPDGQTEAWRAFLGTPVSDEEGPVSSDEIGLVAHPNPANTSTGFTYTLGAPGETVLEVFDILGRRMSEIRGNETTASPVNVTVHTADWPAGIYIARLRTGGQTAQRQFVVMH